MIAMRIILSNRIILLLVSIALCFSLKAQKIGVGEVDSIQIDSIAFTEDFVETKIDYIVSVSQNNIVLPSLFELVDSAIFHSPVVKAQLIFINQKLVKKSIEKKLILRALTINSQYSRGNNNANINSQLLGSPYSSATTTDFYSGGVFLNISLYQFLARKDIISYAKMTYEIELERLEEIKRGIRLQVSQLYTDCLLKEKILKIRQDALSVSDMNYRYGEQAYSSNAIKIQEYTDIIEVYAKLKIAYEQSFTGYVQSIILLEEISGVKFRN